MTAGFDVYPGTAYTGQPEPHVALYVAGRDVTCDTIGQLSIRGGRSDFLSQADAATMSITLQWPETVARPKFGDPVAVAGWIPGHKTTSVRALFYGHITDIAVEGDWWSLVAADPMRTLDGVKIGDVPWPQETLSERFKHVWDALAAKLPDQTWLGTGADLLLHTAQLFWGGQTLLRRDVDAQNGLDLVRSHTSSMFGDVYYRPDRYVPGTTHWPAPSTVDPAGWQPEARLANALSRNSLADYGVTAFVSCKGLVGDPPPRFFQNMGIIVNEWSADVITDWTADPVVHSTVIVRADQQLLQQYGQRSSKLQVDDMLDGTLVGDRPVQMLQRMLERTQVPVFCVDNVVADCTTPVLDSAGTDVVVGNWHALTARGPGQVGASIEVIDDSPGDLNLRGGWQIEQTQIDWAVDGWTVQVTLTPGYLYAGQVQQTRQLIVGDVPATVPSAGFTIPVRVVTPYNGDTAVDGTVTVDGGTPVQLVAGWTDVPVGPLTAGQHTLVVAYTPAAGSNGAATSTTVTVQAYDPAAGWS